MSKFLKTPLIFVRTIKPPGLLRICLSYNCPICDITFHQNNTAKHALQITHTLFETTFQRATFSGLLWIKIFSQEFCRILIHKICFLSGGRMDQTSETTENSHVSCRHNCSFQIPIKLTWESNACRFMYSLVRQLKYILLELDYNLLSLPPRVRIG